MKLPSIKSFVKKEQAAVKAFDVTIMVKAVDNSEAKEMADAIQSFASHFSLAEMKNAEQKLKSPANRKMIKTFL